MGCGTSTQVPPDKFSGDSALELGTDAPVPPDKISASTENSMQCLVDSADGFGTDAPSAGELGEPAKTRQQEKAHTVTDAADVGFAVPDFAEERSEGGRSEEGRSSPGGKRIPVMRMDDKLFQRVRKCLHAQDKMEFSISTGYQQFFNLDTAIFQEDTQHNTKKKLDGLMKRLFAETELKKSFVTLFSSPLNTVNLDDESRRRGAIPKDATFFSFCNPCAVNTMKPRAAIASGMRVIVGFFYLYIRSLYL